MLKHSWGPVFSERDKNNDIDERSLRKMEQFVQTFFRDIIIYALSFSFLLLMHYVIVISGKVLVIHLLEVHNEKHCEKTYM